MITKTGPGVYLGKILVPLRTITFGKEVQNHPGIITAKGKETNDCPQHRENHVHHVVAPLHEHIAYHKHQGEVDGILDPENNVIAELPGNEHLPQNQ